ncbi:MAG: D-alanyl-D-alanine carboxypeptidase family protein [bacterium]
MNILIFVIIGFIIVFFSFTQISFNRLNFLQRYFINHALIKWEKYINDLRKTEYAILDYGKLLDLLNFFERYLIKLILTIHPKAVGFNGPFYSLEKAENLIKVDSVLFGGKGTGRETGVQYCPEHSYKDFCKMCEAIKEETGKSIFIDSGYRSSGRQAYLFIYYLVKDNNYCLKENAKWIALPGYSEHGSPINNAVDMVTEEGVNGFSENQTAEDFELTLEYKWLIQNANKYNFYLSYPKDNKLGVAYEPWHWHWQK